MEGEICVQDKYDERILARRYGIAFDCNNCRRNWLGSKEDIIENNYDPVYAKLRCPYCHNMITIPRNFNWY